MFIEEEDEVKQQNMYQYLTQKNNINRTVESEKIEAIVGLVYMYRFINGQKSFAKRGGWRNFFPETTSDEAINLCCSYKRSRDEPRIKKKRPPTVVWLGIDLLLVRTIVIQDPIE